MSKYELDLEALKQESRKLGVALIAGGYLDLMLMHLPAVSGVVTICCGIVAIMLGSIEEATQ